MNLAPALLLRAYQQGIFPMAIDAQGTIGWFAPDPRAVIPLDERFHVPHGLRKAWRRSVVTGAVAARAERGAATDPTTRPPRSAPAATGVIFEITFDQEFECVMRACAKRAEGTWISEEIVEGYCALHRLGHAHSVETRRARKLVGGLYGVHLGGAFFGESMFHRATDASKVALVALVERLRARGFQLLDSQWLTPHLAQFGACELPRSEYLQMLKKAVEKDCRW